MAASQLAKIFCSALCLSYVTAFQAENPFRTVDSCEDVCSSAFQDYERTICFRGCRFMVIVDFIDGSAATLEESRQSCLEACSSAYGQVNASSCAFGCQSQLPSIELKRKQMERISLSFREDRPGLFGFPSEINAYAQRMMNCMFDQLNHQMTFGWMLISSSGGADGEHNQVVVIRGTPVQIYQGSATMQDGEVSNYLESNLIAVDAGATPDMEEESSQLISAHAVQGYVLSETEAGRRSGDWLSCVSAKTGLSRMSVLMLMFVLLVVFIWFAVGVMLPTSSSRTETREKSGQNLSIYGDSDYLLPLDEKSPELFGGVHKFPQISSAPLPPKSELI